MVKVHKKVDVVTIGAGWTAAVMAWKLGSAGHSLVSLETGPERWANPDFLHNHDALKHEVRKALMFDLSKETWTWRPNSALPALPMRQYGSFLPGRGLGGASVHWTAHFWRFLPADFQHYTHNVERYGRGKIPPDMTIKDWPVTYEEIEPYYDQVEYDIGAAGQAGNLGGRIVPGGNPFEAPRSRPYPLPPHPTTIHGQLFAQACDQLGYRPFPQPAGILSKAYKDLSGRWRSGCIYCGYCTRYGCEVDAKSSAITTHVPVALETGNWRVRTYCKVKYINLNDEGLATGVTYVDQLTGQEYFQPADVVLVTGFVFTNVRQLLLSRNKAHPNGIGNDRGMVGKNYTYQIWQSPVTMTFPKRRFNQFMGNGVVQSVIYDFNADNFDHSRLNFIGGAAVFAGSGERDPLTSTLSVLAPSGGQGSSQGGTNGGEQKNYIPTAGDTGTLSSRGNTWGWEWKNYLRENWDGTIGITMQGEVQAYRQNFLDLDPRYTDEYGLPLLRITFDWQENERQLYRFVAERAREIGRVMNPTRMDFSPEIAQYNIWQYQSTHPTGGAIMGSDPGNSVTNKYGQVWDTPNVFVTGAALYPQNPGSNPSATLLALAYMAGDAIRDRYFRNPGELLV